MSDERGHRPAPCSAPSPEPRLEARANPRRTTACAGLFGSYEKHQPEPGGAAVTPAHYRRRRGGFTMAEATISIILVGGLLVGALELVGAAAKGQMNMGDGARAHLLASGLMAEILTQAYVEPVDVPLFGREPSESGGSRLDYDDVDDYDTWSASPPEAKDGTKMVDLSAWQRSVTVDYVDPNDVTVTRTFDTGAKLITVTAGRGGTVLATVVAVRTNAAQTNPG